MKISAHTPIMAGGREPRPEHQVPDVTNYRMRVQDSFSAQLQFPISTPEEFHANAHFRSVKQQQNNMARQLRIPPGISFRFRASRRPPAADDLAAVCRAQIKTKRLRQAEWIGAPNREVIPGGILSKE